MHYRKIVAGMLLACLLVSGCGNNRDEETESIDVITSSAEVPTEETSETTADTTTEDVSSAEVSSGEEESKDGKEQESSDGSDKSGIEKETQKDTKGQYLDELFEFRVTIGKTEYTLPEDFQTFLDKEWKYDGSKEITLNPNEYISDEAIYKNKYLLYVSLVNLKYDIVPVSQCSVGSITFDQIALKDANANIVLAGDIAYGKSSREDLIRAYGEPDSEEKGENETILTYGDQDYRKVVFTVNLSKDVVTDIQMINYIPPVSDLQISEEVLDIVKNYQAPTQLGKDVQKPLVKFDGAYYELPAPISEFFDNGWKLSDDAYDAVAACSTTAMHLEKGDYRIRVEIKNYTDEIQYLENCFVTWLETNTSYDHLNVEMELPNGIATGMTEKEMLTALGSTTYQKNTESDEKYNFYDVAYNSGRLRLYVLKTEPTLWRIVLYNRPEDIR